MADDELALTPDIVADDKALWGILNEVILALPRYRERRREIIAEQNRLRGLINLEAWRVYLKVEALVHANDEAATTDLVRWVFAEGEKYGGQP